MIMHQALIDLNPAELVKGIKTFCLAHKEIYPGTNIIAHIRGYALGLNEEMSAEEAWAEVLQEVRREGHCGTPQFSSELIKRAVDCIGWKEICISENIGVERAHFFRAFDRLSGRVGFQRLAQIDFDED